MNSRARRRRGRFQTWPGTTLDDWDIFRSWAKFDADGSPLEIGMRRDWDLRNPDDVRFLFGSFDEDEVAEMVSEATEAAKQPPAPPWVVTHIDEKTKTVTFGRVV